MAQSMKTIMLYKCLEKDQKETQYMELLIVGSIYVVELVVKCLFDFSVFSKLWHGHWTIFKLIFKATK